MAFTEVYSALEQKKIDGQENPFAVIASNKLDAVQKYLTETRHIYNPQSFLINIRKTLEVDELAPGELEKIRAKLKPVVEKYSASIGEEFAKFVFAEIAKLRK